jgi:hypothetical protein
MEDSELSEKHEQELDVCRRLHAFVADKRRRGTVVTVVLTEEDGTRFIEVRVKRGVRLTHKPDIYAGYRVKYVHLRMAKPQ